MNEDRFIEIKVPLIITIDKKLLEERGLDEKEVEEFVKVRARSFVERVSRWLTETLSSTLLLATCWKKRRVV